jgi:hypothetical protein
MFRCIRTRGSATSIYKMSRLWSGK